MKKKIVLNDVARIDRLQDILDQAVAACPDRAAYIYRKGKEKVTVSYRQFYDEVRALGSALAELGLDEGHIACIGDNSYNWIRTYLTGLLSRGVFVPVDKQLPEADIINVAVHPSFRRRGIAEAMLARLISDALEAGVRTFFLEVRESNAPARSLYRKLGFDECGRMPRYYSAPVEDAIVMTRSF